MKAGAVVRIAWSLLAVGSSSLLQPVVARAQSNEDPCLVSPVEGQKLRRTGKLLDARVQFSSCARQTCPPEIVQRCAQWNEEVGAAVPSVVFAAHDARGADLVDVRVSIDGQPAAAVGARAIELDPGQHRFVFSSAGHPDVEQPIVLREGEKNREISVTFAPVAGAPGTAPSASAETEPVAPESRPVPAAVWILGGVGLAALASFGTFGALGVSERSNDHCDKGCTSDQNSSVQTKFVIADVSLGVGIVALGIATWLFVTRPHASLPSSALLVRF
jgi:hypothetical protein